MMKHENLNQISAITSGRECSRMSLKSSNHRRSATPNGKRSSLWRPRSISEAPTNPRSPITKAFDFFPWSRNKKQNESQAMTTKAQVSATRDSAMHNYNNHYNNSAAPNAHYHQNIFRKSGFLREILNDRLSKQELGTTVTKDSTNNNSCRKSSKSTRKSKKISAPLDITNLISHVDQEWHARNGNKGEFIRRQFLDDTFIENIMLAKEESVNNLETHFEHHYNNTEHNNGNYSDIEEEDIQAVRQYGNGMTGSKHISNNNKNNNIYDNKIYWTKKTSLEVLENKEIKNFNNDNNKNNYSNNNNNINKNNNYHNNPNNSILKGENILKARLKFQKVPIKNSAHNVVNNQYDKLSSKKEKQTQNSYHRQSSNIDKSSYDNNNIDHRYEQKNDSFYATNVSKNEIIIQKKPQQESTSMRRNGTKNVQLYEAGRQQALDNSSSSSLGSVNEMPVELPKMEKPRKKLSFLEPIVITMNNEDCEKIRRNSPFPQRRVNLLKSTKQLNSTISMPNGAAAVAVTNAANVATAVSGTLNRNNNCNNNNYNNNIKAHDCDSLHKNSRFYNLTTTTTTTSTNTTTIPTTTMSALNVAHASDNYHKHAHLMESQAMRVVRTVGQAFEVCHKFNLHRNSVDQNDERSDISSEVLDAEQLSDHQLSDDELNLKKDQNVTTTIAAEISPPQRTNILELVSTSPAHVKTPCVSADEDKSAMTTSPSSPSHEISKLKDQLEQQALQTRQALAQLMFVREQLISETNARIEAQARTQQLLQQNRELLEHLASLGVYNEQQTPGLTSANIAMAPQSQLQMLLQATNNNNSLATINQQISNLGSINQQLTTLSHQLTGLNQQSQQLQNFHQNHQQHHQQLTTNNTPTAAAIRQSQLQLNATNSKMGSGTPTVGDGSGGGSGGTGGVSSAISNSTGTLNSSPYPSMNQLQNISNQLQQINAQNSQPQPHQQTVATAVVQQHADALSKDLFQVNQDLLNRLHALNLGTINSQPSSPLASLNIPQNSFFYVNPMSCGANTSNNNNKSNNNNNNNNNSQGSNYNFLGSTSPLGNLTPSPMGTLNRNTYSHSPTINEELQFTLDKNLNSLDDQQLIKSYGSVLGIASGGSTPTPNGTTRENSRSSSTVDSPSSPLCGYTDTRYNTVTLKVTDEAGNVTNQRKLTAAPSFITRSTSEKVPNRSQMMSQVQRTAWARHTTK